MSNTSRRTSLTYPNGRVVNLGYGSSDSIDDLFSLVKSAAISGESGNKVEYSRTGLGRFVKISYPQPAVEMSMIRPGGGSMGDSGDPYDGYDRFGRVQEMRWQSSSTGTPIDAWQWGYNEASNRTWKKNLVATSAQDEAYGYDDLYQVIRDAVGTLNTNRTAIGGVPGEEEDFEYDPTGNWLGYRKDANGSVVLDQSRSSNKDNQLTQIDGSSALLSYDRAGNAKKLPPGESGESQLHLNIIWDAWNRIVRVETRGDDWIHLVGEYAYDGLSRRITRTVDEVTTHTYWSDRWKPLEERVGSSTSAARSYLWGERAGHRDELILRDRDTDVDGTLDERLYATMDYFNGTAVFNTSGVVQERYSYSAFGVRRIMAADFTPRSTSNHAWEFGFQGQFRDAETGWYNYGYRFYVPELGRWITRDPIGEWGGRNLYNFVRNNTLDDVDLFGLCWSDARAVLYYEVGGEFGPQLIPLTDTGCVSIVSSNIEFERKHWETVAKGAAESKAYSMDKGQTVNIADGDSVGADSGVFWIGGFTLYRSYGCSITTNSSGDCYRYTCDLYYNMNDSFEDPLDFDNSKRDPFGGDFWDDWETGRPFSVFHQWGPDTVSGGGRI